jgi:cytoskeletal protein CcmA (bactofilin family)
MSNTVRDNTTYNYITVLTEDQNAVQVTQPVTSIIQVNTPGPIRNLSGGRANSFTIWTGVDSIGTSSMNLSGSTVRLTGSFSVSNGLTVTGSISTTGSILHNGLAQFRGGFTIVGNRTFIGAQVSNGGFTQIGVTTIRGNTTITGSLTVSSSLSLVGPSMFRGNQTTSGSVLISGSLTSNANIAAQTITASIINASSFSGSLFGTASWSTQALTASYVNPLNQTVSVNGLLTVTGSVIVSGSNTFTNIGTTSLTGSVNISGSQTFIGTSAFFGNHTLSGSNTITGNTQLSGSLDVSGSSNFHNSIFIVTGSQYYTGSSAFDGNQEITGSLKVTGSFWMNGNRQFNYGAFSSTVPQTLPGANQSASFTYNTVDVVDGVTYSNNSHLNIPHTGVYNIQFSAQLLSAANNVKAYIWLKKNGANLDNTATVIALRNNEEAVAAWNWIYPFVAGDYVEIAWQSNSATTTLERFNASGNIPAVPSVIVTVTQVA